MNRLRISPKCLKFSPSDFPRDTVPSPKSLTCDELHQFNAEVAATHGLAAAAIYQYIAWHCRKFGKWVGTKKHLRTIFPYISPHALRLVLSKLLGKKQGCVRLLARRKEGHEFIYTVTSLVRGCKLHSFDPQIAATSGILTAVILENLDDAEGGDEPAPHITPTKWQSIHYYAALRSVMRAFQFLRETGKLAGGESQAR